LIPGPYNTGLLWLTAEVSLATHYMHAATCSRISWHVARYCCLAVPARGQQAACFRKCIAGSIDTEVQLCTRLNRGAAKPDFNNKEAF